MERVKMEIRASDIAATPLYIIVGSPRSGTNMLHGFLDAHPETVIPTEFPFITLYAPLFRKKSAWTIEDVDNFILRIQEKINYQFWTIDRWHTDIEALRSRLSDLIPNGLDYALACRETISTFISVFPKDFPQVMILKEPAYSLHTKTLLKIFPDVKFIYIHRDVRGQVNSLVRMPFGSRLLTANTWYWKKVQNYLLRQSYKNPEKYFRVAYEDMVMNPEETIREICDFINIRYFSLMLNYSGQRDAIAREYGVINNELMSIGASALKAPDVSMIHKWKKDLTTREIKTIEAGCRRQMLKLGYSPMFRFSFFHQMKYLPVVLHFILQKLAGLVLLILPFNLRMKIIFTPSLFEATFGRVFGKKRADRIPDIRK